MLFFLKENIPKERDQKNTSSFFGGGSALAALGGPQAPSLFGSEGAVGGVGGPDTAQGEQRFARTQTTADLSWEEVVSGDATEEQ